uniref:Putative helix-turn-helix domain containing protein n=1 Tax=viral metagenome TaxID=1070528 RepID=A0A6M3M8M6_9ZZZZ
MHQLYEIIKEVEQTHSGLGNAVAFAIIATKARRCLIIISPAGCGKSAISDAVGSAYPEAIRLDSVTRSGLRDFKDKFTNFWGLVVVDDLGKVDTAYSRVQTVTSFAELCYSHFISKHTMTVTVEISEFHGAAIINLQPPILAQLVQHDEWEVVTQDKTIRYYHLYRPIKPCEEKPKLKIDWGIDLDLVHKPRHDFKLYPKLEDITAIQWSDARVLEHLDTLLRAVAALDRREEVKFEDLVLLYRLMKPMTIEKYIMTKAGFEVGRRMDTNLLAVLVEFASWKHISIERIARDYKISVSTVYRLLAEIKLWFKPSEEARKKLVPTQELQKILKEAGVER